MTGYSVAELKNMRIFELIDPDRIDSARRHFELILTEGRSYGEVSYHTKGGEKRWWNVVATKLSDDHFLGLHEDITMRKMAEEHLRESEEHHAKVISNISDVLWEYEVDSEGQFVRSYISPVADRMLGLPQGSIGHTFEDFFRFVHPEDLPMVRTAISTSLFSKEQKIHRVEYRAITSDGAVKNLFSTGIVYVKPNGNRLVYGTTTDITELKIKEEELLKAKANLTAIVENTHDSIWAINNDYELTYLNRNFRQSFLAVFGVALEPGINKLHSLPEAMVATWKERYDKVLGGEHIEFVDVVETPGIRVYIEVAGNPIIQDGKVIGAAFFGRNITARKKMEQELADSVELNQKLLATIPDVVIQTSPEGVITYVNDPALKDYPFITTDQLIGRHITSFIAPKDLDRYEENFRLMIENPLGLVEYTLTPGDGIELCCEVNGDVMRDSQGNPAGLVFVIRDITERRRMEDLLHRREELLKKQNDALIALMSQGTLFQNDLAKALADITEACSTLVGTERVGVWLYNDDYSEIQCIERYNQSSRHHSSDREVLRCAEFPSYFTTQKNGEVIAARDVYHDPRTCELPRSYYDENNIRSMLDTPVWFHDRLGAILCCEHVGEHREWNSEDIRLATHMATLISLCFQNEERRHAKEELESAMLMLQSALAQSPSGILIADAPDVRIRWANDAALNIRGETDDPLTSIDVSRHSVSWQTYRLDGAPMPSEDLPLSRAILRGETVRNEEVIIRHSTGEDRFVSANSAPIRNSEGEITAGIVVFHDITELKKAEKAQKDMTRKYQELSTLLRLMADNMPDMLWAKNLDREYIFANKAICNNLLNATDTDEPLGKTDMFFAMRERNSRPDNPEWHSFGEVCRDSDTITVEEMKPMRFDEFGNVKGKFLFLDVHKAPLYDESGRLIGVVGSARDVTAAREAEYQLRKLSQAIEQSPASVVITDTEGKIEYVNPRFTEITGYPAEEAIGENPRMLHSGSHPVEFYKELWNAITSGKEWKGEFHNKKKNGELFWESAHISPIKNEKGEILNYLGVKEDISERKALEVNLKQQTRLRELLMEISFGFINIPFDKVSESVNEALGKMALFVNADRAYTFDYDWEENVCNNIYEWCAEGISAEINNLQHVPLEMMQDWVENHKKGEPMYVPDVFSLPHGAAREILEPQGIKSVLSFPMMIDDRCIGFVGFDSVRQHYEYTGTEVQILKLFARLLANIKGRSDMEVKILETKAKVEESEEKHRALVEQMFEGLVVDDGNGIIRFVNPMFCKMTGYEAHELIGRSA